MGSEAPAPVHMLTKLVLHWLGSHLSPRGHWLETGSASTLGLSLHAPFPSPLALSANTKASSKQITIVAPRWSSVLDLGTGLSNLRILTN